MDRRRLLRLAARSLLAVPAAALAVPALGYLAAGGSGRAATGAFSDCCEVSEDNNS